MPFTFLRDPWNWLDFSVIVMAYVTIAFTFYSYQPSTLPDIHFTSAVTHLPERTSNEKGPH